MCMNITDTGATQAWAVSFFFLNLVLAITIAILFMSNTGPGKNIDFMVIINFLLTSKRHCYMGTLVDGALKRSM